MGSPLEVQVAGLVWPTPVALASGTCGYGSELEGLLDWGAVGALFTKGLSLEPRAGHPGPRICDTPSGMLNAIGLENVGLDAFVRDKMSFLRAWRERHGGRVIVNLFGEAPSEYAALAARLSEVEGVDGVELNLSCPNVHAGGIEFGRTAAGCAEVTRAVRRVTTLPVIVKLSPVSPLGAAAKACRDEGADALSIANTMPAMSIDVERRIPRLAAGVGGLSGPALKPIAVRAVYETARACSLPIIGIGGVTIWEDVAEYMLAGATAVQVGTALFTEPNVARTLVDGLASYLARHRMASVAELIGRLEPRERWAEGGGA